MPEPPPSAIGNLSDLQEGQITLSRFIVQREDGLYARRSLLDATTDFFDFVQNVFASGLYFRGLDYAHFVALLYGETAEEAAEKEEEVFVAADITTFKPDRQALYKGFRMAKGEAAYMFEPLFEEDERDEVSELPADPADTGESPVSLGKRWSSETRVTLDVDEFIASAWLKGVRYGIDRAAVEEGIGLERAAQRVIAYSRPFVAGKDAEIVEQAKGLHRNNAPRRLFGGRVDLRQFETRYPQVAAGVRLVQKAPRTPGIDGRDVSGEILPAPKPKDIDLETLAGPGTQVSRDKDGEFVVAAVSGFLQIDTRNQQFSVSDKIISHEGVSTRTTGDLQLAGEIYEQHGEIQEKRIVKCRSITAHADVFGHIVSAGGTVRLKHNLIGGSASNDAGDILVEGVASNAILTALHGCLSIKRAENCVLMGRQVVVERATNCEIVADDLSIDLAEGCAAAGKTIHVRWSRSRNDLDTVLLVLLPDLSDLDKKITALQQKKQALDATSQEHQQRIDALRGEKEVANYLLLAGRLRRHEISLQPDQEVAWRRLSTQVAPLLRTLAQLGEAVKEIEEEAKELGAEIEERVAGRDSACNGLACTVDSIGGDTRISTLSLRTGETPLTELATKELKLRLRRNDVTMRLLFSGAHGTFIWTYSPPVS